MRRLLPIALFLIVVAAPLAAAPRETALGLLESWRRSDRGVSLLCEDSVQVAIDFLDPAMVRVQFLRPDDDEPPLRVAFADTAWATVDLTIEERDLEIIIASRDMDLVIHKIPCRLSFLDKSGTVIHRDDPERGMTWRGDSVAVHRSMAPGERFFGLGVKAGDLDRAGRRWTMWNTDAPGYDDASDTLYQSIPFYIGVHERGAYGIYLNNSYRSTFDFGATDPGRVIIEAGGGRLDYVYIHGPTPAQVSTRFTALTGRPPMWPRWSLGYQQSRYSYPSQRRLLEIAREFRERDIPADVLYLDIDYMDGYRVFTWNPDSFPDPAGLMRDLDRLGFQAVMIIDPGVKVDPRYRIAREGLGGDHFVTWPDGRPFVGRVWPGDSYFPDFAQRGTRRWWGSHLTELLEMGVDGIWNDMNEPALWGGTIPGPVRMGEGGRPFDMRRMHNLYGFHMAQTAWEASLQARPERRPFILTRAGFAGQQRFTTVWSGDNRSRWPDMARGLRIALGLGLSGVAMNGMDVGGFIGSPDPELFVRWMQLGAFTPFFRNHTGKKSGPQEPWAFGPDVESLAREAIALRYGLLPLWYTLMRESHESGSPMIRPMFWHYPDDDRSYRRAFQHQFMVGDALLVAPVLDQGQRRQEVFLPPGRWLDRIRNVVLEGDTVVVLPASLGAIPRFLRAGGIVPRQPPASRVNATGPDTLILDIFADAPYGNFLLYDDDGLSNAYREGDFRQTQFEFVRERDHLTVTRTVERDGFAPPPRTLILRLLQVTEAPHEVQVDGVVAGEESGPLPAWRFDGAGRILEVVLTEQEPRQVVRVRF